MLESLLNKVADLKAWNVIKKRFQQMFYYEIYEIF